MMSPERWSQIEPIIDELHRLPSEARDAYLQQACHGDHQLLKEIAALLDHEESIADFLEAPPLPIPDDVKQIVTPANNNGLIGQRLGNYQIISLLGKGGMGEVYLARDLKLDRKVAIKVLTSALVQDFEIQARFKREAKTLAKIDYHPHIAVIHSLEQHEQYLFLVLEYVPGQTLGEWLKQEKPSLEKSLPVFRQIAEALGAAHKQGIIHRDLKPANIKITPENQVKILDFGLAKFLPENSTTSKISEISQIQTATKSYWTTDRQMILGTVPYMSPEQTRGLNVDHRTDLWAYGCIFFEAITGHRPFNGLDTFDLFHSIRELQPNWQSLPVITPQSILNLLKSCLAKNLPDRLPSATEALTAIDQAVVDLETPQIFNYLKRWQKPILLSATALITIILLVGFHQKISDYFKISDQKSTAIINGIPGEKFLVVLPFTEKNIQSSKSGIGTGLAQGVQTALASIKDLRILPFAAATQAALISKEPAQQMKTVGANLALTGEIERRENSLKINYWIQNLKGTKLFSGAVEGQNTDFAQLQSKIIGNVINDLQLSVASAPTIASFKKESSEEQYLSAITALQKTDLTEKSVDEVIRQLQNILNDEPNDARVLAALANSFLNKEQITHNQNLINTAYDYAEKAIKNDAESIEVLNLKGQLLHLMEKYDEALASYRKVREKQPSNLDAMLGAGLVYEDQGNIAEAEASYQSAVTMWPVFWRTHNELGAFYFSLGKYRQALDEWQIVVNQNPEGASGYINLGHVFLKLKNYQEAGNYYRLSLDKLAGNRQSAEDAYIGWGTAYFYNKEYAEAEKAYLAGIEQNQKSPILWGNLGDVYRKTGVKEDQAFEAYRKAIELSSQEPGPIARSRIAEDYAKRSGLSIISDKITATQKQSDRAQARKIIDNTVKSHPRLPEVLSSAILVYHLIGEETLALKSLAEAIKIGLDPQDLTDDEDLKQLKLDPKYQEIIEKSTAK